MKLRTFFALFTALCLLHGAVATQADETHAYPACDAALEAWRLAPLARTNFIHNMSYMNMDKVRFPHDSFGDYDSWEILYYHGVKVPSSESVPHQELSNLLLSHYENYEGLKIALNSWADKNKIGYRFAFHDDIERLGKEYQAQGLVSVMPPIAPSNGYIPEDLYSLLIKNRLYPLADPHDVLSHLASLTDPLFVHRFNEYAELMNEVEGILGHNVNYFQRAALKKGTDPKLKAYGILWDHLYGTVRDSTHENWTYLVNGPGGEPEFFTQGNATFNAIINGLAKNNGTYFRNEFLNLGGVDDVMYGTEEVNSFSKLSEYLENPHSRQLYDHYIEILKKSLLDRETFKEASAKATAFINQTFDKTQRTGFPKAEEIEQFLHEFARFVSADPQLNYIYQQSSKQELLDASLAFCTDYKNWLAGHI